MRREKQQELEQLPQGYYEAEINTVLEELQQLPLNFSVQHLDDIVEARASVLEVWQPQFFSTSLKSSSLGLLMLYANVGACGDVGSRSCAWAVGHT